MQTIYITTSMAAALAGINGSTLKKLCGKGRVPGAEQPRGPRTHYRIDLELFADGIRSGELGEYRRSPTVIPLEPSPRMCLPEEGAGWEAGPISTQDPSPALSLMDRWYDVLVVGGVVVLVVAVGLSLLRWGW